MTKIDTISQKHIKREFILWMKWYCDFDCKKDNQDESLYYEWNIHQLVLNQQA